MARPTGVTILAVLSFFVAALLLFFSAGCFIVASTMGMPSMDAGVVLLILAVPYLVNGVGLLKLQGWARMLTILLLILGIVFEAWLIARALAPLQAGFVVWELTLIAIDAWILMYLFKPHVKQAFAARVA